MRTPPAPCSDPPAFPRHLIGSIWLRGKRGSPSPDVGMTLRGLRRPRRRKEKECVRFSAHLFSPPLSVIPAALPSALQAGSRCEPAFPCFFPFARQRGNAPCSFRDDGERAEVSVSILGSRLAQVSGWWGRRLGRLIRVRRCARVRRSHSSCPCFFFLACAGSGVLCHPHFVR